MNDTLFQKANLKDTERMNSFRGICDLRRRIRGFGRYHSHRIHVWNIYLHLP